MLQETISSNVTDDTVTLEYQNSDGTLITQFIDFKRVSYLFLFVICKELGLITSASSCPYRSRLTEIGNFDLVLIRDVNCADA